MNNSKRIYQIEEAQFTDLGSKPLGEVPSQSRAIYDAIVAIGNTVFPNSPGQTFTAGLTAGGLAPVTLLSLIHI